MHKQDSFTRNAHVYFAQEGDDLDIPIGMIEVGHRAYSAIVSVSAEQERNARIQMSDIALTLSHAFAALAENTHNREAISAIVSWMPDFTEMCRSLPYEAYAYLLDGIRNA